MSEHDERIFFLERLRDTFVFADLYYRSVIGRPVSAGGSAYDQTIGAIAAVIKSAEPTQKMEAATTLWGVHHPLAGDALLQMSEDRDVSLSMTALAALLSGNDVRGLPRAEIALLQPFTDANLLQNLRVAIRDGMREPSAIPALGRLLVASDVDTRLAAVHAPGSIDSSSVEPFLVRALDDSDVRVQWEAVMGLGRLTHQMVGLPAFELFRKNPQQFVAPWKR